ncbi:serine hydrolase domain-containing protein [Paenibacillus montanisoli]|uniref:Serine hydrolase n=1 Tax=Paenibacillus montanisoli TaxID=2081970 RepID=A0A328U5Q7_9BACL|nr:serine hydrolase domain-containing protein [Paenibacillus montanisoli]RAP77412.1 serine hydrolase [Paenibacillus montanisoli]
MRRNLVKSDGTYKLINDYMRLTQQQLACSAAAICILQHGQIVHEWYAGTHEAGGGGRTVGPESQFHLASIRKTYLGFAVSLALEEGKIGSVDDEVTSYLELPDTELLRHTTIRHLLTHTHGLKGGHTRMFPPGTDWSYNNSGVNLLIRLIENVYGCPLAELLQERVFEPLGFSATGWRKERSEQLVWMNETYAGERGDEANLFANARELAYWGQLHLTKGEAGGRQMFPRSVFERATTAASPASLPESLPRNGFFWWVQDLPRAMSELGDRLPAGSYQSLGIYGNAVLVIPQGNIVAVRMLNQSGENPPGYDYLADIKNFGNIVWDCARKSAWRHS